MISHIHHNLNVNEDFVMLFTSKFMTCFFDNSFTCFQFHFGGEIPINCLFKGK